MTENKVRSLLSRDSAAIMGILNVTPDSFYDGGRYDSSKVALQRALQLVREGVDIIDVGGESSRPGAAKVGQQQELDRVLPIVELLSKELDVAISIDTYKPVVMQEAVAAGASMVNDINGLRAEGAIEMLKDLGVPVCLMHMQGEPTSMQTSPNYKNVVREVSDYFVTRIERCLQVGMDKVNIVVDPGIGFGKTLNHNLELLANLSELRKASGCHMLIGVSRKSLIGKLLGRELDERLPASIGLAVQSVISGAKIVRVHDVRASFDAIRAVEAVLQQRN